jgi:hypothetical protein
LFIFLPASPPLLALPAAPARLLRTPGRIGHTLDTPSGTVTETDYAIIVDVSMSISDSTRTITDVGIETLSVFETILEVNALVD